MVSIYTGDKRKGDDNKYNGPVVVPPKRQCQLSLSPFPSHPMRADVEEGNPVVTAVPGIPDGAVGEVHGGENNSAIADSMDSADNHIGDQPDAANRPSIAPLMGESRPVHSLMQSTRTPPVWANTRSALCDALDYFRSHEGGNYNKDGITHGILLDGIGSIRDYANGTVLVTNM